MPDPIIIIGAGQAGASLAARLRALGYDGPLLMLGEEPVPPYQRPPLSKKYMSGELDLSRLLIRPQSWYEEQDVELRLSTPVAALSPGERLQTSITRLNACRTRHGAQRMRSPSALTPSRVS